MLLSAEAVNTRDDVMLDVFEIGGKRRVVNPPFQPYFYSLSARANGVQTRKRLLSTLKETVLYKCEFPTTSALEQNRDRDSLEADVPFIQRIAIDLGFKFPSTEPKLMAWDIETYCQGAVPDWRFDRIRSISYWINKENSDCFINEPYSEESERVAIKSFLNSIRIHDPDIITDFFGRFYDLPTLKNRCSNLNIKCALGRDNSEPYVKVREFERRGRGKVENTWRINGRVHFDCNKEADADYSLTLAGVETNLHDVSKHFAEKVGFAPPIEGVNHAHIPSDRLRDVNLDDARCTLEDAKVYLGVIYQIAELFDIPLSMAVDRQPSHISNYVFGREFAKQGIVSDGSNRDRFPWVFKNRRACEGAIVRCELQGLHRNVENEDYSSFYPSIQIAFNLSPETVSLVAVKPYTGKYNFVVQGDYAVIEVPELPKKPEDFPARQVICKIDLSHDSVARIKQREFIQMRKQTILESRNNAIKVISTSSFGYHINSWSRWGNALVGILITAIARFILSKTVEERRSQGWRIIEVDSDGFYGVPAK